MGGDARSEGNGLRDHVLTRRFQGARLRVLPETMASLVRFHAGSKLLLLAYSEPEMRRLGRVVANTGGRPAAEVAELYRTGFLAALGDPPRRGGVVNALQHAAGHFSSVLSPAEKAAFGERVRGYASGLEPLDVALWQVRSWAARHSRPWVAAQSFLNPYPAWLRAGAVPVGMSGAEGVPCVSW
jgi:uncharacterized protein YbgA (DUF1722 family)